MTVTVDPALFAPSAIPAETRKLNADIIARMNAEPTGLTIQEIRARRLQGLGAFPLPPKSSRAETIAIDGPAGKLDLRIIAPKNPRGIYFHIHGGGWSIGAADQLDPVLDRFADEAGMACVSVEYRLAPEHQYPAGPAFSAALMNYGCFDLGMTPSARRWGEEKLVLNTPAIVGFGRCFLPPGTNTADPDVSPLYADLRDMPAALFTIGTRDALLDDSLFMAPRWLAAGNVSELAVYPGACHGFVSIDFPQRDESVSRMVAFLKRYAA